MKNGDKVLMVTKRLVSKILVPIDDLEFLLEGVLNLFKNFYFLANISDKKYFVQILQAIKIPSEQPMVDNNIDIESHMIYFEFPPH